MAPEHLTIRAAEPSDLPAAEAIRELAFRPVFRSFRAILGDVIYEAAQQHEDDAQAGLLEAMFEATSEWTVFVLEQHGTMAGFCALRFDKTHGAGEIGLNAIHPEHAGRGLGTRMYAFALEEMRRAGLKVATVATGGDPSHAAARRAYEKAGFNVTIPSVWMCREL